MKYGFNRRNFVADILNDRFAGDEQACAAALGMSERYLKKVIYHRERGIGLATMSKIRAYCLQNGLDHETYILVREESL